MNNTAPKGTLDPVAAEIMRNSFVAVVRQMSRLIVRSTFSYIIREAFDFCTAVVAPKQPPELELDIVAMSESLAHFSGCMPFMVRNLVDEYGLENMEDGDVIAINNPYMAGNHIYDNGFFKPIYYQGKFLGAICTKAHILDMGGVVPGGYSVEKRNIWEDGLVISGVPVYRNNQPYKPGFNLYFANSRVPHLVLGDIQALFSAMRFGEKALIGLAQKYGVEHLHEAMAYSLDYAERSMRQGFSWLPDGEYSGEDGLDGDFFNDQPYDIKCKVTKKGDEVEVDFSGSSRVAASSMNCTVYDTANGTYTAFKWLFDPVNPNNSGAFRPINLVLPENTFISALPPHSTTSYFDTAEAVFNAVVKALLNGVKERGFGGHYGTNLGLSCNGQDTRSGRERFFLVAYVALGAFGATDAGDAEHFVSLSQQNIMDPSVEATEEEFPVLILRKEFVQDSGGPGKHRGGTSVLVDRVVLDDTEARNLFLHMKILPWGCVGGKEGASGGVWMVPPDIWKFEEKGLLPTLNGISPPGFYRDYTEPLAGYYNPDTHEIDHQGGQWYRGLNRVFQLKRDTTIRIISPGGGGWGDPLERDIELVKRDVRDGYVSLEGAKRDYGVVVKGDPDADPEALEVDYQATEQIRRSRKEG